MRVVVAVVIAVVGWQFACGYAQISLLSAEAKAMQRATAAAQLSAGVRSQDKQTAKKTDGNNSEKYSMIVVHDEKQICEIPYIVQIINILLSVDEKLKSS